MKPEHFPLCNKAKNSALNETGKFSLMLTWTLRTGCLMFLLSSADFDTPADIKLKVLPIIAEYKLRKKRLQPEAY